MNLVKSELVCENSNPRQIGCANDEEIYVRSVYHGPIWVSSCGHGPQKPRCIGKSKGALQSLREKCAGRSTCSVDIKNMTSEKCLTEARHLHIQYACLGE